MAPPKVRRARVSDVPLLVRHRRLMWKDIAEHPKAELDAADPVYRRWITARLRNGRAAAFIVDVRGRAVASGVLWLQEVQPRPGSRRTHQGYLLSMYTDPAHRRRGCAAAIVGAATAWTRERGFARVTLHAAPMGRGVYEKAGFQQTREMRLILDPGPRPARVRRR